MHFKLNLIFFFEKTSFSSDNPNRSIFYRTVLRSQFGVETTLQIIFHQFLLIRRIDLVKLDWTNPLKFSIDGLIIFHFSVFFTMKNGRTVNRFNFNNPSSVRTSSLSNSGVVFLVRHWHQPLNVTILFLNSSLFFKKDADIDPSSQRIFIAGSSKFVRCNSIYSNFDFKESDGKPKFNLLEDLNILIKFCLFSLVDTGYSALSVAYSSSRRRVILLNRITFY